MGSNPIASLPRHYGKWCACLLVLLTPGSFVVLPAVFLIRWLNRKEGWFRKAELTLHADRRDGPR